MAPPPPQPAIIAALSPAPRRRALAEYAVGGALLAMALRVLLVQRLSDAMTIRLTVYAFGPHVTPLAMLPWLLGGAAGGAALGWWLAGRRAYAPAWPPVRLLYGLLPLVAGWGGVAHLKWLHNAGWLGTPPAWLLSALGLAYPPALPWLIVALVLTAAWLAGEAMTLPLWRAPAWLPARAPALLVATLTGLFIGVFAVLNVRQLLACNLGFADAGYVAEALWNTLHGRFLHSNNLGHPQLLADHWSPVWLALIPVYALYPDFQTLCVVTAVLLGACIPLTYRLARAYHASPWVAAACATGVFLYAPLTLQNSSFTYGFQAETFGMPLLLAAFYYLPRERAYAGRDFAKLCAWLALTLLSKETLALPVGMCGLYVCWRTRRWHWGVPLFLAGVAYGHAATTYFMPWLKGGQSFFQFEWYYGHLGRTVGEVLWHVAGQPGFLLDRLTDDLTVVTTVLLLLPFGFLALWRADALAIAGATAFFMLIAGPAMTRSLGHHYMQTMLPPIILATVAGLAHARDVLARRWHRPPTHIQQGLVTGMLFLAVVTAWLYGAGPGARTHEPAFFDHQRPYARRVAALKRLLPRDAPLYASFRLAARFTDRPELHVVESARLTGARPPDFILVDPGNPWSAPALKRAFLAPYLASPDYVQLSDELGIVFLARRAALSRLPLEDPAFREVFPRGLPPLPPAPAPTPPPPAP